MKKLALEKADLGAHVVVYGGISAFIGALALAVFWLVLWAYYSIIGGVLGFSQGSHLTQKLLVALVTGWVLACLLFVIQIFSRRTRQSVEEYNEVKRTLGIARERHAAQGGDVSLIEGEAGGELSLSGDGVEGGELSMLEGEKGALSEPLGD